jgi:hypothetical protein
MPTFYEGFRNYAFDINHAKAWLLLFFPSPLEGEGLDEGKLL